MSTVSSFPPALSWISVPGKVKSRARSATLEPSISIALMAASRSELESESSDAIASLAERKSCRCWSERARSGSTACHGTQRQHR